MNTKLAIELLAESHDNLTAFLSGLGLLNNETAFTELKTKFDDLFQVFLEHYDNLKAKVTVTSSKIETVEERLNFADDYYRVEEERLQKLLADKAALVKEIEIFEEQKESIEKFSDEEKLVIQAKVYEIKQDIFETEEEIAKLRQAPNSNEQQISVLNRELNAHILRYSLQKDLLSLSGLDTAQKLESVKLQIQQQTEDLETLNNQEIVEQETIVNNANQNLSDLQSELEALQATATLAETELTDFETINAYLLAEDVTEFLDWNIDENTPEVVKLWQQYLAVEGEEIISERLISLQSQAASEDAVTVALETDSIEGYVILGAELAEEIESLSAIWLENLQESHKLTVDVWNLSEKRTEAVNELEIYIEDNLADPEGEYLLDQIQLQEAIARQEAQVNYADALGDSVDSLEEAIAILNTQQQQVNLLSEKIDHISKLTTYEQGYTTIQNAKLQLETLQNQHKQIADLRKKIAEIWAREAELLGIQYQYNGKINPKTNNLYFLVSNNSWTGAQAKAKELGGNLVTINNKEEQTWIHQNFGGNYWIGLTDKDHEGSWKWVSGEIISYWNFLPGQPDNANNEDFAHMNWTGDGRWNDLPNAGLHFRLSIMLLIVQDGK